MSTTRIGTGYDIHRLAEGRPLVLGGVEIPFEKGLGGHSDSDVLTHSICDALLGAAALGDIGTHFPDTDPKFSGASSLDFLAYIVKLIDAAGYVIANVDVTVIAERPRLKPYVETIRSKLASTLRVGLDCVSVKGKTNEGLDSVGRGEAMAAYAIVAIHRRGAEPAEATQR